MQHIPAKKYLVVGFTAAACIFSAACKSTVEKTTDTVSDTTATVVHKTNPFATDTTTTTTQKFMNPPPTSSRDKPNQ